MAGFQIISEKNKPKFVVLPFDDEKAVQDYMDELWAEKAAADFKKYKPEKLYSMEGITLLLSTSPNFYLMLHLMLCSVSRPIYSTILIIYQYHLFHKY